MEKNVNKLRLLVCGSRDWENKDLIKQEILELQKQYEIEVIIHGACRGADLMSGQVAKELGIPMQQYPANWSLHGKSAGPKRNQQMIDEGNPNFVLAFHDDIDESKGTKDMVLRAQKHNIPFKVVRYILTGEELIKSFER